ncbi:MAG TPA: hypothetical protein VKG23_14990 [Thermoanaerobaculia bacterium]|nr:hypothetical protein [Thermoanaerobaculia bacterium]
MSSEPRTFTLCEGDADDLRKGVQEIEHGLVLIEAAIDAAERRTREALLRGASSLLLGAFFKTRFAHEHLMAPGPLGVVRE